MATRIYRPTAPSYREANLDNANENISHLLATYATDIKNRRLKRAVTTKERDYKLTEDRSKAWIRPLESSGRAITAADRSLQREANELREQGQRLQVLTAQAKPINDKLTRWDKRIKEIQATVKKSGWTAALVSEFNPLATKYNALLTPENKALIDRWSRDSQFYNAAQREFQRSQRGYQQDYRAYQGLQKQYDRSTRSAQRAFKAYEAAVKAYNEGFYPI